MACLVLAACATSPEHENFKHVMSRQVGKHVDDPDFYPVYYRLKPVEGKRLPNGNRQEAYEGGRRGKCRLLFEVDGAQRVAGWSFDGDPSDCVIVPLTPEPAR
jgi:hypothetical protein